MISRTPASLFTSTSRGLAATAANLRLRWLHLAGSAAITARYFDQVLQREVALRLAECLRPSGALVLGAHETLPEGSNTLLPWAESLGVYRARVGT